MAPPIAPLYRAEIVDLRAAAAGRPAAGLSSLRDGEAEMLGAAFAAMDPWKAYGFPAENLARFFAASEPDARRWAIRVDDRLAGAVVIRAPWLHGPYLQFLGLLPGDEGQGLGRLVLDWMAREGQGRVRNLWLCVSEINGRARAFYEREGFERVALFDALVADGMDEILMRKKLF